MAAEFSLMDCGVDGTEILEIGPAEFEPAAIGCKYILSPVQFAVMLRH